MSDAASGGGTLLGGRRGLTLRLPQLQPAISLSTCVQLLSATISGHSPVQADTEPGNVTAARGQEIRELESIPRDDVALHISLDSATPELHDAHRGWGSWAKVLAGIRLAIELGFRVRVAATVAAPASES